MSAVVNGHEHLPFASDLRSQTRNTFRLDGYPNQSPISFVLTLIFSLLLTIIIDRSETNSS